MFDIISEILAATIRQGTPLLMIALGEIYVERSGVINIGIEGNAITGAFIGWFVSLKLSSWGMLAPVVGLIASASVGMIVALIFSFFVLRLKTDQVVTGTGINLLAFGLVHLLYTQLVGETGEALKSSIFNTIPVPILAQIPILGQIFFQHNILVYITFLSLPILYIHLFRTRYGLSIQSCGEHPKAADTLGIKVSELQTKCLLFGGAMAGMAGAYLSLAHVPYFNPDMTAGRGFIGLAIVIFGGWHPIKAGGAALVFGFGSALSDRLQARMLGIPHQFLQLLPYVLTLLVLAGLLGRTRAPSALAVPFRRE
ncbi:ABC transporter permease [Candidatus Poribacteria bacterium]|nr:ABC transporter permease [Candidatus Poribacteria bacterium]